MGIVVGRSWVGGTKMDIYGDYHVSRGKLHILPRKRHVIHMRELIELENSNAHGILHELAGIIGTHTECISLYIPPRKQLADIVGYVNNELHASSNIKSKGNRKRVQRGLVSLLS